MHLTNTAILLYSAADVERLEAALEVLERKVQLKEEPANLKARNDSEKDLEACDTDKEGEASLHTAEVDDADEKDLQDEFLEEWPMIDSAYLVENDPLESEYHTIFDFDDDSSAVPMGVADESSEITEEFGHIGVKRKQTGSQDHNDIKPKFS